MKAFSLMYRRLESTTSTLKRTAIIADFFRQASDKDKLWTIALFTHKRPRRTITTSYLRLWAAELANIPNWLFEDTYHIVGDLAETIAKIIPPPTYTSDNSLSYWVEMLIALKDKEEADKKEAILEAWKILDTDSRFLFNKLITGGFRIGVAQRTIVKALSAVLDQEENVIAHKLMGNWSPLAISYEELLLSDDPTADSSKPYPFYLASPLDSPLDKLGSASEWYAEYKWDGMRSQLIKRDNNVFLWSRGEELIIDQFPEFITLRSVESDFVIDGEILVFRDNQIKGFDHIQKRVGRKKVSKKILESHPAIMMAYDIMELNNNDIRQLSQANRRIKLESLIDQNDFSNLIKISPLISFNDWSALGQIRNLAREKNAEGLMLKSKLGPYKTGRKRGDWYKWKVDPMTFDGVLLYAQRGHGRRANLYSDFTFAVKDGDNLVPITKSYIGLTDNELTQISQFVRKNTIERFGPVSSVTPKLVFEVGFEGISKSNRRKVGISLRSPRILRWRHDKSVNEIDCLSDILRFLK